MKQAVAAKTLLAMSLVPSLAAVRDVRSIPENAPQVLGVTKCDVSGATQITITCNYTGAPQDANVTNAIPRIVLNHAMLSFETNNESHRKIELTFTNQSAAAIS